MITFISCLAILIIGYFVYGTYVDKNAKLSDDNQTPAVRLEDGVDYMPMPWHKVFSYSILEYSRYWTNIWCNTLEHYLDLLHFYGLHLVVYLQVAVHDHLSGVISMKHDGTSVPEIVGMYLGDGYEIR